MYFFSLDFPCVLVGIVPRGAPTAALAPTAAEGGNGAADGTAKGAAEDSDQKKIPAELIFSLADKKRWEKKFAKKLCLPKNFFFTKFFLLLETFVL